MVTEVFGNILYYPETEHVKEFPSPEFLKNRVILSTKPPKEYLEAKSFKEKDFEHSDSKKNNEETAWGREVPDLDTEIESAAAKVTILSISMVYYSSCFNAFFNLLLATCWIHNQIRNSLFLPPTPPTACCCLSFFYFLFFLSGL